MLCALSGMVAQHAQQLRSMLSSITALDIASSRGRHAAWLGATSPPTFLSPEGAAVRGMVHLPRAWHPLLLQPCLPPLPTLLLTEEMQQQMEGSLPQRWVSRGGCRHVGHAEMPLPWAYGVFAGATWLARSLSSLGQCSVRPLLSSHPPPSFLAMQRTTLRPCLGA